MLTIERLIEEAAGERERMEKQCREENLADLIAAFELMEPLIEQKETLKTNEYGQEYTVYVDIDPEHPGFIHPHTQSLFDLTAEESIQNGKFYVIIQSGVPATIRRGISFESAQRIVGDSLHLAIVGN